MWQATPELVAFCVYIVDPAAPTVRPVARRSLCPLCLRLASSGVRVLNRLSCPRSQSALPSAQ